MKKRILGLLLLATILLTHPGQAAFGGFRVGGMFGVQYLQGRHWYDGNTTATSNVDQVKRLSVISGLYGVHAGYLFEIMPSKFVVGAEVYAFLPQGTTIISLQPLNGVIEGTAKIQHTRSIGIALTAGMMFNPKVMVYVNAGLEAAKFEFRYAFPSPVRTAAGGLFTLPQSQTIHHTYKAIVAGIGATYKIGPHFLIGLEVSNPLFRRFKIRNEAPRAYQYKPVERRAMLKFTYLF
jgi:opacity protein-like surface antigen